MEATLELLKLGQMDSNNRVITQEIADACIKIRNLGYRLSDDDYERLEQRLKEIKKYMEAHPCIEGYNNS